MIKILSLMMLLHIIDDFVLQPICLSKLKQRKWWEENIKGSSELKKYKDDYITALIIHSLSWSIMIHLPLFLIITNEIWLSISIAINMIIHCVVDDLKANYKKINLTEDQSVHMIQILITFLLFTIYK